MSNMKRFSRYALFVCLGLICLAPHATAQQRRRIAVLGFDVATDAAKNAKDKLGINNNLGATISDLVVDKLVHDGNFIVVERAALEKILKEQDLSNGDRFDPGTAAKIGRIAGVDAIVIGTVTQFSVENKGSLANSALKHIHIGGAGVDRQTLNVSALTTARLIDTSNATILATATGTAENSGTRSSGTGAVDYSPTSTDFGNSLAGQVIIATANSLATQIETKAADTLPPLKMVYDGVVADVAGNSLILNIGEKVGVQKGDIVKISRMLRTVKDPKTGAVLKVINEDLGEAKVTEVDKDSSTATFSGTGKVQVNDMAKSKP
jgi:curli biogenesis system outer membrane secretion channel CsgG